MNSFLEWLQTTQGQITIVIIVLTAVITVIAGMVIPPLGRLLLKLVRSTYRLPKRGWAMLRKWCYWRHYRPDYGIIDKGKINIERFNYNYKMSLQIILRFETKDDLEQLTIDCNGICLKIDSPNYKGRKKSYELIYRNGETETLWTFLASAKPLEVEYILTGWTMGEPRLGNTARCKVQSIGIATLKGITKNLKIKQPFDVDVIREGNNTSG